MKFSRIIPGLLYFLLLSGLEVAAQKESALMVEFIPQKYVVPAQDVNLQSTSLVLDGNIWEVISDRNYNTSQVSSSRRTMFKTLEYLEKYYVIESRDEMLHLVKDKNLSEEGILSEHAIDYGWVPASKMLLWKHCLTDDYGRDKRVFMFKNAHTVDFFVDFDQKDESNYFQVLYVFKEENNRLLLSRSSRLTGDSVQLKKNILGWVNSEHVYEWTHNTFVQPDRLDSEITDEDNINVFPVFINKGSVKALLKKSRLNSSQVIWKTNPNEVWDYSYFRFPLLSQKDFIGQIEYDRNLRQINLHETSTTNLSFNSGYCLLDRGSGINSYKTVMLLSKNQLSELLIILEKLASLLQDEGRDNQTALKLLEIFGFRSFIPSKKIENAGLYNLFEWKYGLLPQKKMKGPPFYKIIRLSAEENIALIKSLEDAIQVLGSLTYKQSSNNSFFSNGTVYYWVPLNNFPLQSSDTEK